MNDATMDDAHDVGMTTLAETITAGTTVCGILLTESSREFLNTFDQSDLIISKAGQLRIASEHSPETNHRLCPQSEVRYHS
jgi:uncharacterized protein with ATP-grasp and redox domains